MFFACHFNTTFGKPLQKLGRLFLFNRINSLSDAHRSEQPAERAERERCRDALLNAQRNPPAASRGTASLSPTSAGRSLSPAPHHRTAAAAAPAAPSRPRPPEWGTAAPGRWRRGRGPGRDPSGGGSAFPEPERPLPASRAEAGAARLGTEPVRARLGCPAGEYCGEARELRGSPARLGRRRPVPGCRRETFKQGLCSPLLAWQQWDPWLFPQC